MSILIFLKIMLNFSVKDTTELVEIYFRNGNSATAASRKFTTAHGVKKKNDAPSEAYIRSLIRKFRKTGQVTRLCYKTNRSGSFDFRKLSDKISDTVETIENNGGVASLRKIVSSGHVPRSSSTARRVLKNTMRWKPYRYNVVHHLPE